MLARPAAILVLVALAGAPLTQPPAPAAAAAPLEAAAGALSPRNANYTIAARLDASARTISGDGTLRWRNTTATPATTLQFHLYYNAWRDARSSFMRERQLPRPDPTLATRPESDWGSIDVTAIRLAGTDLTSRKRFIAPDDGNADDRTVMEVPLERPVAPGETIDVQLTWTSHVPRTFARTGTIGNFYFIAQWFPKLGVWTDQGWNCHQFHSATEFFSDFGVYDVQLTVPSGWVVGATGVERGQKDEGNGTTTHHYVQEDVHDFAWTTSPDYLVRTARFEHATLPAVEMRLLLQPEHAAQADRHFAATRAALKYYGEWFGPYPYGHVTIVDPAWQSGAGGMEYPTLFTAGSRWLAPAGVTTPEGVTIHEAGHQFWYGIVASNEFEHAWMDEGFNTFSTARVIEQAYNPNYPASRYFGGFVPWVFRDIRLSRVTDGDRLGAFRPVASADVPATPTWRYWPGTASAITYNKTALWLHTLERMLGWDTTQRILSTYFSRYAFKHPRPEDFFAVANEVSGQDLTWFFDQVYRSANTFDYGVEVFRSTPTGTGSYRTTLVARRYGAGQFPVDVRVVLENNEEVRWRWDGKDQWKLFEVDKPSRAVSAEVDPDHVLLLDLRYSNNAATLRPEADKAARKWSLTWLVWLQDQLLTYGFFI